MELQALEAAKPAFDKYGASLLAISPQTAPNSRKSMRQNKLSFPILSDAKGKVGAAFGLRFDLPDYLIELYKQLKNDLPTFNDDPSWTLPMPARYAAEVLADLDRGRRLRTGFGGGRRRGRGRPPRCIRPSLHLQPGSAPAAAAPPSAQPP